MFNSAFKLSQLILMRPCDGCRVHNNWELDISDFSLFTTGRELRFFLELRIPDLNITDVMIWHRFFHSSKLSWKHHERSLNYLANSTCRPLLRLLLLYPSAAAVLGKNPSKTAVLTCVPSNCYLRISQIDTLSFVWQWSSNTKRNIHLKRDGLRARK